MPRADGVSIRTDLNHRLNGDGMDANITWIFLAGVAVGVFISIFTGFAALLVWSGS